MKYGSYEGIEFCSLKQGAKKNLSKYIDAILGL